MKKIKFLLTAILLIEILLPQNSPLDTYSQTTYPSQIAWIDDDLSGVTINIDNNHLYLIEDDHGIIWETNTDLSLIRTISGGSFGDTEDIVSIGQNEYAIVLESGDLFIGYIPNNDSYINIDPDSFQKITFTNHDGNSGPEGVAYDSLNQVFYIVKEKDPMEFYVFQRPYHTNDTIISVQIPFDAEVCFSGIMDDLSSIAFDYRTNRVLIVSDDSKKIIDVNPLDGTIYGTLELNEMNQAEGICFLNNNYDLLIVGEPNYYTIYSNVLDIHDKIIKKEFSLFQNYPNPFNPITTIPVYIETESKTNVSVFDLKGNKIKNIISNEKRQGHITIIWNGFNNNGIRVSSGAYILQLDVEGNKISRKMTLIK